MTDSHDHFGKEEGDFGDTPNPVRGPAGPLDSRQGTGPTQRSLWTPGQGPDLPMEAPGLPAKDWTYPWKRLDSRPGTVATLGWGHPRVDLQISEHLRTMDQTVTRYVAVVLDAPCRVK